MAGLKAELNARKRTQEAHLESLSQLGAHGVNAKHSELGAPHRVNQASLLKTQEQIAQLDALQAVYKRDEESEERLSARSRSSIHSSVAKKSELAGLKAELNARRRTQEAHLELARAKHQADLLKMEEEIAKVFN